MTDGTLSVKAIDLRIASLLNSTPLLKCMATKNLCDKRMLTGSNNESSVHLLNTINVLKGI